MAAIDPYVQVNIVSPTEKKVRGGDLVEWGDGNQYPQYLKGLYDNVTTLRTIIKGDIDFVTGDMVTLTPKVSTDITGEKMNRRGGTIRDQVKDLARDLDLFGGFALQVIRDKGGRIAELYYIPMDYLRSDSDNQVFYYCEHWGKRGPKDVKVYPKYSPGLVWETLDEAGRDHHASSILYIKSDHDGTYPQPTFAAAVKAAELERCIDDYHINAICNDFEASVLINFNNGEPDDQKKLEVEEDVEEKFTGYQNARRIMTSWNADKDHAATIVPFPVNSFGEKYKALAEHSRQQIFCAFRAVPSLFGLPTASGFSQEEYESAFKLYNRTQIQPMQRTIVEAYERLLGSGCLTIKPFSLDGNTEDNIS